MPAAHRVLVRAMFAFFAHLVPHADASGASAVALGRLFGPLLIRTR
jgi:hypothetical protein